MLSTTFIFMQLNQPIHKTAFPPSSDHECKCFILCIRNPFLYGNPLLPPFWKGGRGGFHD